MYYAPNYATHFSTCSWQCLFIYPVGNRKINVTFKKLSACICPGFRLDKVPQNLDVIVIGSGIGGLAAGATLAKAGKKVLVLEQHYQAGGCCHTYIEKGFEFDVGKRTCQGLYHFQGTALPVVRGLWISSSTQLFFFWMFLKIGKMNGFTSCSSLHNSIDCINSQMIKKKCFRKHHRLSKKKKKKTNFTITYDKEKQEILTI